MEQKTTQNETELIRMNAKDRAMQTAETCRQLYGEPKAKNADELLVAMKVLLHHASCGNMKGLGILRRPFNPFEEGLWLDAFLGAWPEADRLLNDQSASGPIELDEDVLQTLGPADAPVNVTPRDRFLARAFPFLNVAAYTVPVKR